MLSTLELRWFSYGTLPTEVKHWFSTDCPGKLLGSPEEREDLYLYIPECDELNIKLRQGSLEVKWRKAELGILRCELPWQGKVEKWLKWICKDSEQQSILPATVAGEKAWVTVKKVRSQRLYRDISYELTQLSVKIDTWWSVAFEMADKEANSFNTFEGVVREVSKTYRGSELPVKNSYAYPHWLSLLK